jgi:uncharacterized lipoprotein YajG
MKGNETPLIGNPEMENLQVQVLLSAPIFVKMKKVLFSLLGTALLTGCMHNYDLTLTNGTKITGVSKPKFNKESGSYTYKNVRGEQRSISASRVAEIAPH